MSPQPRHNAPSKYLFVLLRHGESEGNARNVHQGQADFPLTEAGREQARRLARAWAEQGVTFDGIIASPLKRAAETARIVAETLGFPVEAIVYDAVWKERDKGNFTGQPFHQTAASPASLYHPVGETGESIWEVYQRATEALRRLLANPPGRYLVVSHGGITNLVIHAILGIPPQPYPHTPSFRFPNTGYIVFSYRPEPHRWHILGLCHRLEEGEFPCV